MDHLPLAPGASWTQEDLVPYVASRDYHGIPFLEYLEQYKSLSEISEALSHSSAELDRIAQTCFFFALLQELLAEQFVESDYIAARSGDTAKLYIITESLERDLRRYAQQTQVEVDEQRQRTRSHLETCCRAIGPIWGQLHLRVDRKVARGLRGLWASVRYALMEAFGSKSWWVPSVRESWPEDRDISIMVSKGGWCPFEAKKAWRLLESVNSAMFLRSMTRRQVDTRHVRCTVEHCELASQQKQDLYCAHASDDCSCDQAFGVLDDAHLLAILRRGETPLIRASVTRTSDDMLLELVAAKSSTRYVAISHVWSDGSGNPFANALRLCRLRSIINKVFELEQFTGTATMEAEQLEVHIWLDTICVPVNSKPDQVLALGQMVDYYKSASCVLVLDREIQAHTYDETQHVMAGTVIFTSRWMLRLWTMQEAVLASSLYFAFANTFVERCAFIDAGLLEPSRRELPYGLGAIYTDLFVCATRLFVRPGRMLRGMTAFSLEDLLNSVQHRMVTVASDEPLCLANLLGFSVASVEEHDGYRMSMFWKGACELQMFGQEMIFNPFARLKLEHYGWAPATLLAREYDSSLHDRLYFPPFSSIPLHTDQGLSVVFPGMICSTAVAAVSIEQVFAAAKQADLAACLIKDEARAQWYYFAWSDYITRPLDSSLHTSSAALVMNSTEVGVHSSVKTVLAIPCDLSGRAVRTIKVGALFLAPPDETSLFTTLLTSPALESDKYDANDCETSHKIWQGWATTSEKRRWMGGIHDILRRGLYLEIVEKYSKPRSWIVG